jgi:hypothetical protein
MTGAAWSEIRAAIAAFNVVAPSALAEEVDVGYRGRLSLDDFDCSAVQSSFIHRVCYGKQRNARPNDSSRRVTEGGAARRFRNCASSASSAQNSEQK